MERVFLGNCCEKYVLKYGRCFEDEEEFPCLPCGHKWKKDQNGDFTEKATGKTYRRALRKGFEFLQPADGLSPILNKCCSDVILEYGMDVPLSFVFQCPVCGTKWTIISDIGLPAARLCVDGKGRHFMIMDEGSPPYLRLIR